MNGEKGTKTGLGSFGLDQQDLTSPINPFNDVEMTRAIEKGRTAEYYPISPLSDANDPEFVIPASNLEYIMLQKTRIGGEMQIVKVDAEGNEINLDADDDISIINLPIGSLYKLADLTLNGTPVSDVSSFSYPYKQWIEVKLKKSKYK